MSELGDVLKRLEEKAQGYRMQSTRAGLSSAERALDRGIAWGMRHAVEGVRWAMAVDEEKNQ